jgi:hypothetical protein
LFYLVEVEVDLRFALRLFRVAFHIAAPVVVRSLLGAGVEPFEPLQLCEVADNLLIIIIISSAKEPHDSQRRSRVENSSGKPCFDLTHTAVVEPVVEIGVVKWPHVSQ